MSPTPPWAALGPGVPPIEALQQLADRTSPLDVLARFVDGLVVAIERGTPLAEVRRAQAADVREAGKRQLLEAGGRKEIQMMVPVVFLVLPISNKRLSEGRTDLSRWTVKPTPAVPGNVRPDSPQCRRTKGR
ncbi:type II secretion system F family protein [Modestobacter excelsi]|uniref:type II secretion system F family protein n=1 Tax=Modestobacter excelsi TaxID=2213161 RepID=UPI001FE32578|nr:type II secretion system F family protein [Modestobacter excelsi]